MKRKIIIDCDNTFSVKGCDLDDGLAIIYLLAHEDIDLLAVTCSFGNNKLEVTYPNTISFMKKIGQEHIPVYKGEYENAKENKAAQILVEKANKYPGELELLVTGSLTNLYHAWQLDPEFYDKIKRISLMGGITEPLIINGKRLKELNFSVDQEAALNLLEKGKNMIIATGNTCLDGFFTKERFEDLKEGNEFEKWLYRESLYWFNREWYIFRNKGIYIWDILAAAALLKPDFFLGIQTDISPDKESIKEGLILGKGKKNQIVIPKIKNEKEYIEDVYEKFKIFGEKKYKIN